MCELGGAYLIWLWLKTGRSFLYGIAGAVVLVAYGIMHTLQASNYGRIQAAYSGFFIALALLWGWKIDGIKPDQWDLIGASVCVTGVLIIMYAPRN